MNKILIKNGSLLSPADGLLQVKKDILIENGIITRIDEAILDETATIVDASNYIVSPGLIDIHTHCYPFSKIGLSPDTLGIERGATTIFDAGSSGAENYLEFKTEHIDKNKTKVYTLLNVSKVGLSTLHELSDLNNIDEKALEELVAKYPDNIVGLKARASASVVGDLGLLPIEIAAKIAKKMNLPLMVHVGN